MQLVPLAGLEPATHGLGIRCSIHTELQGYLEQELCSYTLYPFAPHFSILSLHSQIADQRDSPVRHNSLFFVGSI